MSASAPSRRRRPAHPRARLARLVLALPVLAVAVGLAGPAAAHDTLVAAEPPDGAVVEPAPAEVVLTFSAEPLEMGPVIVVADAAGEAVTDAAPAVVGRDVRLALPDLAPGDYSVTWRVVSSDGHPIEGAHGFTVAGTAPEDPAEATTTAPPAAETTPDVVAPTGEPSTTDVGSGLAALPTWLKIAVGIAALGSVAGLVVLGVRQWRETR